MPLATCGMGNMCKQHGHHVQAASHTIVEGVAHVVIHVPQGLHSMVAKWLGGLACNFLAILGTVTSRKLRHACACPN